MSTRDDTISSLLRLPWISVGESCSLWWDGACGHSGAIQSLEERRRSIKAIGDSSASPNLPEHEGRRMMPFPAELRHPRRLRLHSGTGDLRGISCRPSAGGASQRDARFEALHFQYTDTARGAGAEACAIVRTKANIDASTADGHAVTSRLEVQHGRVQVVYPSYVQRVRVTRPPPPSREIRSRRRVSDEV